MTIRIRRPRGQPRGTLGQRHDDVHQTDREAQHQRFLSRRKPDTSTSKRTVAASGCTRRSPDRRLRSLRRLRSTRAPLDAAAGAAPDWSPPETPAKTLGACAGNASSSSRTLRNRWKCEPIMSRGAPSPCMTMLSNAASAVFRHITGLAPLNPNSASEICSAGSPQKTFSSPQRSTSVRKPSDSAV